jgi:hypothetical protein
MSCIKRLKAKVENYVSSTFQNEVERKQRRVGRDGEIFVYTLRDFKSMECVFIHVPRAAGTSICQALFGHSAGGHVETIEKDFAAICWRLDEDADLSMMNATPDDRPPLGAYYDSDAVIQRVQEIYRSDFERFGYSRNVRRAGADRGGE